MPENTRSADIGPLHNAFFRENVHWFFTQHVDRTLYECICYRFRIDALVFFPSVTICVDHVRVQTVFTRSGSDRKRVFREPLKHGSRPIPGADSKTG